MIFAITKYVSNPTVSTITHKQFREVRPPPVVTICPVNQFDWFAAKELGYTFKSDFLTGKVSKGLVNWGGARNSSFEESKRLLFKANFDHIYVDGISVMDLVDKFILPHGHCKQIVNMDQADDVINIYTNTTELEVFVTDPAKSSYFRISESSFEGDKLHLHPTHNTSVKHQRFYSLNLDETHLDKSQKGQECHDYGTGEFATYADCIENELRKEYLPLLGCMVPWMSQTYQCRGLIEDKFDFVNNSGLDLLMEKIERTYDWPSKLCLVPCIQTRIKSKLSRELVTINEDNFIEIHFESSVMVLSSVSSYDFMALVVEVGSSLGLWLGLSALGLFDVVVLSYRKVTGWFKKK